MTRLVGEWRMFSHIFPVRCVYMMKHHSIILDMREQGVMFIRHVVVDTVLGKVTIVASDHAVLGVYFPHHWYLPPEGTFGAEVSVRDFPLLCMASSQLDEYLAGLRTSFDVPITTHGDPFQERVWALLRAIPRGERTTYGALAEQLGDKSLAQSVGRAVGRNPLCVIVPCHRVVGAGGRLTGYAGGLQRKQFLLDLEEPTEVKAGKLF